MALSTIVVAQAQDNPYPIFTVDHLAGTMDTIGPNFAAARRALGTEDYSFAKERFIRAREQLATTITFWRQNDRDDAAQWIREAVTKFDELDGILSEENVDVDGVTSTAGDVGRICASCHAVYREQDPDSGEYRLKPGSVG